MPNSVRINDGSEVELFTSTNPAYVQGASGITVPSVDSIGRAVVDLAASTANQVLVAAPGAGKQIWVLGLFCMADVAAGTIVFQDEDDTALTGTIALSDEGGFVWPITPNLSVPWLLVPTNKALEADTGACTVDGVITYAVVSV